MKRMVPEAGSCPAAFRKYSRKCRKTHGSGSSPEGVRKLSRKPYFQVHACARKFKTATYIYVYIYIYLYNTRMQVETVNLNTVRTRHR